MDLLFFTKGVLLGFSIAAPVGPIGVLCIRRTLANGLVNGFLSGLGAATADGIYGLIAAFGITVISTFLLDNQVYLHLIGGLFLLRLGYLTFKTAPAGIASKEEDKTRLGSYVSAFFLTLTNPMTIMSFAAVFAGLGGATTGGDYVLAALLVLGVFVGSMLWWLILSGTVNVLRTKFDSQKLIWINKISGFIIACFGVVSLISHPFFIFM